MTDVREFELLGLDEEDHRMFEDHEVKTAPLVSRDAINLGERFPQRALLGSLLSIHSDGLPSLPEDRRIYLNLDAPSSGLVCGVQGSGKSHTVSCILESALMDDERVGALPVPLTALVFHYDEENGNRPCEAAYLGELKNRAGPGVPVTVLVSPSNLNTRHAIYSGLRNVQVSPLKLSEEDLNASRMLTMMNAHQLESMPLYLSTALSILRDMGSDGFTYQGFQARLKEARFNREQKRMLQQRLNLLDSFLRGDGGHLRSFFKPGNLVIVDISDPFVETTVAAMIFDICLGVFVEGQTGKGKLIVLDEAHKYLTNSDANQFTKSVCSIIRQQRHLAARVVVSTQEPTVVPPAILDLLAWIICHRFSSPSWVAHLKNHMCIQQKETFTDQWGTAETKFDWGKKVMMLGTGQGILYSPGSLFTSLQGRPELLGTGCAVIKTRARLTTDGGESLLATQAPPEHALHPGLMTPASVFATVPPVSPTFVTVGFSRVDTNDSRAALQERGATKDDSPSRATAPCHYEVSRADTTDPMVATSASISPFSQQHEEVSDSIITSSTNPIVSSAEPVGPQPPAPYAALVDVLTKIRRNSGCAWVDPAFLSAALRRQKTPYTGKFKGWLNRAAQAGIIAIQKGEGTYWVALHPRLVHQEATATSGATREQAPEWSIISDPPVIANPSATAESPPDQYRVLIEVLTRLHEITGGTWFCTVSLPTALLRYQNKPYTGNIRSWLRKAVQEGVIDMRKWEDTYWVALRALPDRSPSLQDTSNSPVVGTSSDSS